MTPPTFRSDRRLVAGTRRSALARWQTAHVTDRLAAAGFEVDVLDVVTTGDRILDVPLARIGDKGLFTKELDVALLEGRIDFAVHSLKDLPTRLPDGIVLAAVLKRAEPWDAFVAGPLLGGKMDELPHGARVATSSLRRAAQLLAWRPDLEIVDVRGNVETRLAKLEANGWEGMILAEAGLRRLGLEAAIRGRVPMPVMLPAVGQGAVAVVTSADAGGLRRAFDEVLNDAPTRFAVTAERSFLRRLEGGCQVPIGALARTYDQGIVLEGCVASLDGKALLRDSIEGPAEEAAALGVDLAERLLARGADRILAGVRNFDAPRPAPERRPSVVLFRASRADDPFERVLRPAGWIVRCVPPLRYVFEDPAPLRAALARPDHYGGLTLTSPRAVDALEADPVALARLRSGWTDHPAFIMAPETAARMERLGLAVHGTTAGTGAALAAQLADLRPERPLLFLSGRPRREEFVAVLEERGVAYDEVAVYRSEANRPLPEAGPAPDWVVFFSPRGALLVAQEPPEGIEAARKAAIGPTTAQAMRDLGWTVDAVAEAPTAENLLDALQAAHHTP